MITDAERIADLERRLEIRTRDLKDALKQKGQHGERWKHHQAEADRLRAALQKAVVIDDDIKDRLRFMINDADMYERVVFVLNKALAPQEQEGTK